MKSLKSHFSLITALFSILITLQLFLSLERVITAYENKLNDNYGIVVVADGNLSEAFFKRIDSVIKSAEPLSPKRMLQQLQRLAADSDINLMELDLPHFYRLRLTRFVTPDEARTLGNRLKKEHAVLRVETFAQQHDTVYRMLQLFKGVVIVLAGVLFLVTSLLIVKEMRLWQFQHRDRMNIMALFGAPVWLRSAVLFRLAIVDAVIASLLAVVAFTLVIHYGWVDRILELIQIDAALFAPARDIPLLLGVAVSLSILLASMIVMGHKEEV
jgi:cell division transport system permease protein